MINKIRNSYKSSYAVGTAGRGNRKKQVRVLLFLFTCFLMWIYGYPREEIKYFAAGKEIPGAEFIKNGKNGTSITYINGIKISECEMSGGQLHGKTIEWYVTGQKKSEKEYKYGKADGRAIEWDARGKRKSETNYCSGLKQGIYAAWHEQGQKIIEGKYVQGKEEGRWLKWDKDGNLINEEYWKNGWLRLLKDLIRHTEISFIYYPGGQKKLQREYRGKMKHGKWVKWRADGSKRYEHEFRDGMKHGKWIEWETTGAIDKEDIWEKGRLIKKIK